jgi:neutral ceramidase
VSWLEETLANLVTAASRQMRAVTLGVGEGRVDFTVNRRTRTPRGTIARANPLGVVDRRVRVLRVDPADAPPAPGTLGHKPLPQRDPVAVMFSYACHAVVLRGENLRYSSDYPGAARRFVEQVYQADGDAPYALFLAGCAGNLRPHLLAPDGTFRSGTDHELTVLGRWLGSEVVKTAEQIAGEPVPRIAVARRDVHLPYAHVPDAAELRTHLGGPTHYWAAALLDRLERDGRLPTAETTEVQVLRLGRHWIIALPGETTLEIGHSIERGLVEFGLAQPEMGDLTLVLGYANDYVAYLCSASIMTEGGYEPTSWAEYVRCGPFAFDLEAILANTALELAREIA